MWQPVWIFIASICFFLTMAGSYTKQSKMLLYVSGILYIFSAVAATVIIWPGISPVAAALIIGITIVIPATGLLIFLIDFVFAPFCLEMRYLVIAWWLLTPLALPMNAMGIFLSAFL